MIKNGLQLESVCMLTGDSASSRLCTLSVKGVVSLFKVKEVMSMDSCTLEWQASLSDILKLKQSPELDDKKVYVE